MISITKTYAAAGSAVIFNESPKTKLREAESRISRTATLDGGVVIDQQGYFIGDRTLDIRASLTKEKADLIWEIYKDELYINLSTNDGYFYGAIESIKIDNGKLVLKFLIKE